MNPRRRARLPTMLRWFWKRGPEWTAGGPVLVSTTKIEVHRFRDVPGVYLAGFRLRRAWPNLQGAVGLLFWARPWERRSGAISVWRTEEDLHRFVAWPVHVRIMDAYRHRATVTNESWHADRFIPHEVRQDARQTLVLGRPSEPKHNPSSASQAR